MKKLLLIFMSFVVINSEIRPSEGLIGAGAYIATSVLVSAMINAIKPKTEPTPFSPKTLYPSAFAATAGIMAYQGKSIEACYAIIVSLATALGVVVGTTAQSTENLIYPYLNKSNN